MTRAFVIGHPIAHSRSPLIHRHWMRELGIEGSYEAIDVAPSDLAQFVGTLASNGFSGGNVTIPHKEAAFRLANRRDDAAEAIGAVNTLWLEDGELWGANTDAHGFSANLDQNAPQWRAAEAALVLGAGGAALAVVHALQEAGIRDIRIANRTRERSRELADRFRGHATVADWKELDDAAAGAGLIVNTTSLGMKGEGVIPLDLSRLPEAAIVNDLVYVPLKTGLLEDAERAGLIAVDGLGMLLHQAAPGFARWFGIAPAVTAGLRAMIVADLENRT
jgi:shikimate dehydrogenase